MGDDVVLYCVRKVGPPQPRLVFSIGVHHKPYSPHARFGSVAGAHGAPRCCDNFAQFCWAVAQVPGQPLNVVKEIMGGIGKLDALLCFVS